MPVLVGTSARAFEMSAPPLYQACVFPAFIAFVAAAVERRSAPRVAVVVLTGALAVVRLARGIPLSGHATFLAAAASFDVRMPRAHRAPWVVASSLAALLVVLAHKMAWHDTAWCVGSIVAGAALGALCAKRDAASSRAALIDKVGPDDDGPIGR
jgi:hypothetical protein